jgi:hypothetical protein
VDQSSVSSHYYSIKRAKVPGGWLILCEFSINAGNQDVEDLTRGAQISFYPDSTHQWNGGSLP